MLIIIHDYDKYVTKKTSDRWYLDYIPSLNDRFDKKLFSEKEKNKTISIDDFDCINFTFRPTYLKKKMVKRNLKY